MRRITLRLFLLAVVSLFLGGCSITPYPDSKELTTEPQYVYGMVYNPTDRWFWLFPNGRYMQQRYKGKWETVEFLRMYPTARADSVRVELPHGNQVAYCFTVAWYDRQNVWRTQKVIFAPDPIRGNAFEGADWDYVWRSFRR